jgi:AraC-like DNA-binding protein
VRQPFASAFQRAGAFAHLASVVRSLGGSPADVADGLGIDLDVLVPDDTLRFADCLALLERAAAQTGCGHVGLLMGAQYRWAQHGIIHRLAKEAPTLREALEDFVGWQLGYASGAAVYLHRAGRDFALGYGIYERASPGSRHLYEAVVAIGCEILRDLTGGRVRPLEVQISHAGPDDSAIYHRILRAPVRFNQGQCCLIISGDDIDWPRRDVEPGRREQVIAQITKALGGPAGRISARVRHLVRPQLLRGDPSMAGMARSLGLAPRTLRRQLAAEDAVFETIRDEVRLNASRELLALTDLPVGEIAAAVAFASHAAFDQAFRRWSGTSPTAWQRATVGAASDANVSGSSGSGGRATTNRA